MDLPLYRKGNVSLNGLQMENKHGMEMAAVLCTRHGAVGHSEVNLLFITSYEVTLLTEQDNIRHEKTHCNV